MAAKMVERIYNDPKWRKVLLETPSGFALFEVDEFVFKEPDVLVHFSFFPTHASPFPFFFWTLEAVINFHMFYHFSLQDIWVYFSDLTARKVRLAILFGKYYYFFFPFTFDSSFLLLGQFLFVLGFVKFNDKAAAWDGETRCSKDLMRLIHKFCDDKNDLFVQSADLQAVITKKLVSVFPQLFSSCQKLHASF